MTCLLCLVGADDARQKDSKVPQTIKKTWEQMMKHSNTWWHIMELMIGQLFMMSLIQHLQKRNMVLDTNAAWFIKATRGGLNANFHISCWPPLVALTIFAEPSQIIK